MQSHVQTRILGLTGASGVAGVQLIQPLWNNYGTLSRVHLDGGAYPSVIVKHIKIPDDVAHPRGFGGSISRERKIRSYQVETHWYQEQNTGLPESAPTPRCLDAFAEAGELFLLLEDLGNRGFKHVLWNAAWDEIGVVLRWLAHFHGATLGDAGEGLWPSGTYWHLQTRPDELATSKAHAFIPLPHFWTLGFGVAGIQAWFMGTPRWRTSSLTTMERGSPLWTFNTWGGARP